ncbi:THAP domain-containing protein 3-like isoform X2 [Odontomachus brunneus]|uniref:THAP domain-containing protein 3-like isoform X2 n=1 Tax=Odontomachus brunneus TaxID=486640 RepID=UPI0013F2A479|nr:THAP domain-containing protein 3-like isoform X2 [Odontomachus brunneus]
MNESFYKCLNFIFICYSETMVLYCCICKAKWTLDKDISLFRFPKTEDMLKEWLRVIPTVKQVKSHSRVCQAHFRESEYCRISNKLILNKNAIPSIFSQSVLMNADCSNILASESSGSESVIRNKSTVSPEKINIEDLSSDSFVSLKRKGMKEEEIQVSPDVKISPRRLQPSIREEQLLHETQILKKRLSRRDVKLANMTALLQHLKQHLKNTDKTNKS